MSLPTLYPETAARRSRLPVDGGHELQLHEWGNPLGQPALLLHGGPGSSCTPLLARVFDPARYRVIGFDQRGAGLSTPAGSTAHNTTDDLLADVRALRAHLGVPRSLVVGGSWGATLALLHAADCPEAVTALLLRGVFVARRADVDAFFAAAPPGFDDGWRPWREQAGRDGLDFVELLDHVMNHGSSDEQTALASAWWRFEQTMDGGSPASPADPATLCARYRVQAHYLRHGCWLDRRPLLERLTGLPPVPTLLLHGELDRICPWPGALAVQAAAPHAVLRRIDAAGHAPTHPALVAAMVRALDHFAECGHFGMEPAA